MRITKLSALAMLLSLGLTIPAMAQEEDVTSFIQNPSFDEDLTFQPDGTMKTAVSTTTSLSDRSWAYIAEDNTVYARPKASSSQQRKDGRNKLDAVNGFIGRIKGWEIVTNQTFPNCEWVYFGSIPYALGYDAIPIADDGDSYLDVPSKPAEIDTDDNVGAVYLRAGWGGSCVYKQEVQLPCAVYRMDYWVRNFNYESSRNNTGVENLCKVTCRRDKFVDEDGFAAPNWIKHSIEFTPVDKFTIEFGFKSNGGSASNPFLFIDGIKLYRIGDADPVVLLKSDLIAQLETDLPELAQETPYENLSRQIQQLIATYTPVIDSQNQGELQEAVNVLTTAIEDIRAAITATPEVQTLVSDVNNLLSGTEYPVATAALKAARDKAQTALSSGEAADVLAAKTDLPAAIQNYNNSIQLYDLLTALQTSLQNTKASAAACNATQAAITAARTIYESGTVTDEALTEQTDKLASAREVLEASASLYRELTIAISDLETAVQKKALQSLLDGAKTLLTETKQGYEAASIADADIPARITAMNEKVTAIDASATEYAKLIVAIEGLRVAIAEASAETAHVAKSTLTKANLRLNASQTLYDNGTIADADIAARVEAINELITELTKSIELYRQFNTGLTALKTALATEEKMAAATRTAAQQVYDTALEAYNEGSIDDDKMEAQVTALSAQVTAIETSVARYADLAEALPALETAVQEKALQTLLDEAATLLTETQQGYEAASIADADIAARITAISEKVDAINASAEAYATLKAAIERLEAAIEEVGDEATKSSLKKAELRLTASRNLYVNGTIADADIPARVSAIDELIESLTASKRLRQQYDAAIEKLDLAVANASGKVSDKMLNNATALQAAIVTDYTEGNVDDENVEDEIARIDNIVAALEAAPAAYEVLAQLQQNLDCISEAQQASQQQIAEARQKVEVGYLTEDYRYQAENVIAAGEQTLAAAIDERADLHPEPLDGADLTLGSAKVTAIENKLKAQLTQSNTILENSTQAGTTTLEQVNTYLMSSAYIVELKGEYATFCSMADLDFTEVEGLKAYVATEFDAARSVVKMQEVNKVPAGAGVLLVADEAGEYTIAAGDGSADFETNLLVGNPTKGAIAATTGEKTNFILVATDEAAAFSPTQAGTLAAGRAYLSLAVTAGVKGVGLFFDDLATGLRTLRYVADGAQWHDLTGKKLAGRPTKAGIYLRNGVKVAIK